MARLDLYVLLALVLSVEFSVLSAIRLLKEGPMFGPDGREYKTLPIEIEDLATEKLPGLPSSNSSSVNVQCTESTMIVRIKADIYQNGYRATPGELFLGPVANSEIPDGCMAVAVNDDEYAIEAGLHDCGSKLTIFGDSMIYSNNVVFSPATRYHSIMRIASTVIPISCHYQSSTFVSSNGQVPHLTISAAGHSDEYGFFLKLMTDDWKSERSSNIFFLGDVLHLEASYSDPASVPRQIFIDDCVATLEPYATSVPRYYFIENKGCFTDAKERRSNARFWQRTSADKLQLDLDAFLFHQDPRNSIFITCTMKATTQMWTGSPITKACNYEYSRWRSADGNDHVCRCCDAVCYDSPPDWNSKTTRKSGRISEDTTVCGTVTFGPIMIYPRK